MKAEAAKAAWYKKAGGDGGIQEGAEGPGKGKKRATKVTGEGAQKRSKKGEEKLVKSEDEEMV